MMDRSVERWTALKSEHNMEHENGNKTKLKTMKNENARKNNSVASISLCRKID